jgi:uncharacterized protein (TIGR02466 family)
MMQKYEFFPSVIFTYSEHVDNPKYISLKKDLLNSIKKDQKNSKTPLGWSCNVKTNYDNDNDNDFLKKHFDFYNMIIEYFLKSMNFNETKYLGWNCSSIWYNIYKKGTFQEKHDHWPSMFSLIHLLKYDKKKHSPPKFYNPLKYNNFYRRDQINDRMYENSISLNDLVEGTVIVFPSYLEHSVPENKSREERISIAMNFDVKFL